MDGSRIILAAHRGDKKYFPENTMPAFDSALRLGVDMIETDIHMTSDGHLVLIHDRNLIRTTGFNGFSDQTSLQDIRKLDAGAWFSPNFIKTKIPTIEEFIDLIKDSDLLINWELKDYPSTVGDSFAFQSADELISMIQQHGLEERSMLNSFSDRLLEYIHDNYSYPFLIHGQGIYHCQKTYDSATIKQEQLYNWCCLYPNKKGYAPLDFPENFEHCIQHGIYPCVCVADNFDAYKRYVELGCRMFTSNDIYEADRILKELGLRT